MFVQVIQGTTKEAEALREQRLGGSGSSCPGPQGSSEPRGGVSYDGEFITAARFESEEAAQRNSQRPEQGRWWSETQPSMAKLASTTRPTWTSSWTEARMMQASCR
jgi:hypothetical protein